MVSPKSENLVRFAGPNEQRNELERCRRLLGTGLALIGVVAVYLLSVLHLSRRSLNSGDASLAEETVTRIAHHLNDRRMQVAFHASWGPSSGLIVYKIYFAC